MAEGREPGGGPQGNPSPRCVVGNSHCLSVSAEGPRKDTCRRLVCTWELSPENLRHPVGLCPWPPWQEMVGTQSQAIL